MGSLLRGYLITGIPGICSLEATTIRSQTILYLANVFPSVAPGFIRSAGDSSQDGISTLYSSRLLSQCSTSDVLRATLAATQGLSSSSVYLCIEEDAS